MGALDSDVGPYYSPGRQTAASPYQSTNDLIKWFWFTFPFERISAGFRDFYGSWGIGWALDALGVSPYSDEYEGGKNQVFALDHADPNQDVENQWYNADGKNYRATGASHSFSVNWEEGVIMGMNRKSPRNAAEERKPPVPNDLLPGLNQFSDVAWIIWEGLVKRNNGDVKNLRYFISLGIDNADTKAILTRAINGKPGEYPGLTFDAQSQEGKAIMGKSIFLSSLSNPLATQCTVNASSLPHSPIARYFPALCRDQANIPRRDPERPGLRVLLDPAQTAARKHVHLQASGVPWRDSA
jgi:hypothetical protein